MVFVMTGKDACTPQCVLDVRRVLMFGFCDDRDGRLYATVRAGHNTWTVAYPGFKAGNWSDVDISWHPEVGTFPITSFVLVLHE